MPRIFRRRNPEPGFRLFWLLVVIFTSGSPLLAGDLDGVRQLVVGTASDWNANKGSIQRYEKSGKEWKPVGEPIAVLFGRSGLAWGRGVRGQEQTGSEKVEKDWRAPAGLFRIGKIYTYDKSLPEGSNYPFHTVGAGDAWIDDVAHPQYNQHVVVDPKNPPSWFEKQKMRHGDFAYHWLVEIRHNSDPPAAGKGSAIFFHIRRGPSKPSAGCTTMAKEDLVTLIRWLRADARPHYALLPKAEYDRLWKSWGLPKP